MTEWKCVLVLNNRRECVAGSEIQLCHAIRNGADLKIETKFYHDEHIDVKSDNHELIIEVSEFRETLLIKDCWSAGIMTLRQPVSLPGSFASRPSMSFFLYNQNGEQAIARPYLDGVPAADEHLDMPKYHRKDYWDARTNAVCSNFIYDFEEYRYLVCDSWKEAYANEVDGITINGSVDALAEAFVKGCDVKAGIRGICSDLIDGSVAAVDHEVFIQLGYCYYYTNEKLFIAETHPMVRVRPDIQVNYVSKGWDFGWLLVRSDGFISGLICDPYTLKFRRFEQYCPIRWFVKSRNGTVQS